MRDKSIIHQKICLQDHVFSTVQCSQPAHMLLLKVLEKCKSLKKSERQKYAQQKDIQNKPLPEVNR